MGAINREQLTCKDGMKFGGFFYVLPIFILYSSYMRPI